MIRVLKAGLALAFASVLACTVSYAQERPEFDDSSVIVVMKPHKSQISLYSTETIFEGLGIAQVKNLDNPACTGVSLYSTDNERQTLKLTLADSGTENVLKVIDELNSMAEVEYAQPDYYYYLSDYTPDDTYYKSGNQYGLTKVGTEKVWDMNIDCSSTVVAVLDSGMRMTHEDLKDNLWVNIGEIAGNGIDDDGNGYIDDVNGWNFVKNSGDATDDVGHGTHVAGIISAVTNNSKGVASLARNARLMPLKIFGDTGQSQTSYAYEAIGYIKKMGIPIANCSWGGSEYDEVLKQQIESCKDALFVTAAGNAKSGEVPVDIDISPVYPAAFGLCNILSVGSSDKNDNISTFSNYGVKNVHIAAPGSSIYSTYSTNNFSYKSMGGTSMACPLVTSAAAVLKSTEPNLTPEEMFDNILKGADTVSSLEGKINGMKRLNAYNILPTPSPTAKPTPSPVPSPTATPTPSLVLSPTVNPTPSPSPDTMGNVEIETDGDKITAHIEFPEGSEIYEGKIRVYAAYKEKGILKHIDELALAEGMVSFEIPSEYQQCDAEIYVWDLDMCPLTRTKIIR